MPTDPFEQFFRRPTRRSFRALVRAEQSAVTSAAWRVLGDRGLAEDVAQELFMAALQHSPNLEQGEHRASWLARTIGLARTKLRGERRIQARERRAAEELSANSPSHPDQIAALFEVREAVEGLPEEWKRCTELRYFAGLSSEEIASELSLSRRAVDERLLKARQNLESKLSAIGVAALASPPECVLTGVSTASLYAMGTSLPTLTLKSVLLIGAFLSVYFTIWVVSTLRSQEQTVALSGASTAFETPNAAGSSKSSPDRVAAATGSLAVPDSTGSSRETLIPAHAESSEASAEHSGPMSLILRVVNSAGLPLPGATIHFEADGLKTMSAIFSLDEEHSEFEPWQSLLEPIALGKESEWSVTGLPQGLSGLNFLVNAFADGMGSAETLRFTISENAQTELTIVCPELRRVRVVCLNARSDVPVPQARITTKTEADRRGLDSSDATFEVDGSGALQLVDLGAGEQTLVIQADGFVPLETTLPSDFGPEITLRLEPLVNAATLEIRAVGPLGEALQQTAVTLTHYSADAHRSEVTDENGKAVFRDLPPGEGYQVELDLRAITTVFRGVKRTPDRWTTMMAFVELAESEHKYITLGELFGKARRAFQYVDAQGNALAEQDLFVSGPVGKLATSDENGWLVLNNLPQGVWKIDYGHGRTHKFEILEGDDSDAEARIVLGDASITGIVRGPDGKAQPNALIILVGQQGDMTRSDEEGRFLVEHLPRGEAYEVHAHHADFDDIVQSTVTDPKGAPVTVELSFR